MVSQRCQEFCRLNPVLARSAALLLLSLRLNSLCLEQQFKHCMACWLHIYCKPCCTRNLPLKCVWLAGSVVASLGVEYCAYNCLKQEGIGNLLNFLSE